MKSCSVTPWSFVLALATVLPLGCGGGTTLSVGNGDPGTGNLSPSSVVISASPAAAAAGATVTLTGVVSPSSAGGSVTFYDETADNATLGLRATVSGAATLPVSTMAPGTHVLTGYYSSTTNNAASVSAPINVVISAVGANCGLGMANVVLLSGAATQTGQTYTSSGTNESAVCAANSGTALTLVNPTISGASATTGVLDIQGLGDTVLAYGASATAASGGVITVNGGSISSSGAATIYPVFASGAGAAITLNGTTVSDMGIALNGGFDISEGYGIGAARGGRVTLNSVDAQLSAPAYGQFDGALLVTNSDGSSIVVNGGSLTSAAGLAWVQGGSSLTITGAALAATGSSGGFGLGNNVGNGSSTGVGTLTIAGGSYTWVDTFFAEVAPPAFGVSGGAVAINLSGTTLTPVLTGSGVQRFLLANAYTVPNYAPGITNVTVPATVTLLASAETIPGNMETDSLSSITLTLQNQSSWTGYFSGVGGMPGTANLTIDSTSTWTVTGNCAVNAFSDPGGISGTTVTNVMGNGNVVTYNSAASPALGGKTYSLAGGGTLQPR